MDSDGSNQTINKAIGMKRVLVIAMAIALVGFTCNAEEIKWMSWNDGYKMAKKQKKPMEIPGSKRFWQRSIRSAT